MAASAGSAAALGRAGNRPAKIGTGPKAAGPKPAAPPKPGGKASRLAGKHSGVGASKIKAKGASPAKAASSAGSAASSPAGELRPPVTKEQRAEFVQAFAQSDKARTGTLSFGQAAKLASSLGCATTRTQVRNLARRGGVEGEAGVSSDQFADLVMGHLMRQPRLTEDQMADALRRLPAAASGSMMGEVALKMLGSCGEALDAEELEMLAKEAKIKPGSEVTVRHLLAVLMRSE